MKISYCVLATAVLALAVGIAHAEQASPLQGDSRTGRGQRDVSFTLASNTSDCSSCGCASSSDCCATEGCGCTNGCASCPCDSGCSCGSCGDCGCGGCGNCGCGGCGCGDGRSGLFDGDGRMFDRDGGRGPLRELLGRYDRFCGPTWAVTADVVYMVRTEPHPAALILDSDTGATALDASQFHFNWNTGADITIDHRINNCWTLDVRFLDVDGFHANQTFTTPTDFAVATNPPLFGFGPTDLNATYTSRLYSYEVNLAHRLDNKVVWLWGFRAVQIHENLQMLTDLGGNLTDMSFKIPAAKTG